MKAILSPQGLRLLQKFADAKTVLILDYDGTLSPIVRRQTMAVITRATRALVRRVSKLYPTTVLSGRALRDVSWRMRGSGIAESVGNHGLEWKGSARSRQLQKRMAEWKREIRKAMRSGRLPEQGIEVEDKNLSLSIHYRQAHDHVAAKHRFMEFLGSLRGAHLIEGKCVINVLPAANVNKGTAVLALKRKYRCERAIFVGDDKTDEYAFALKKKDFLLDIRIGRSRTSRARYFLPDQPSIDRFLQTLIVLRS